MAWTIPLDGDYAISWLFGEWDDTHTYQHKGLDFGTMGITGLPVVAPTGMIIETTGTDESGYGNYVKGSTEDGLTIILGHLKSFSNNYVEGDYVAAGDLLGYSGGEPGAPGAGKTTGPHLHLEVRRGGVPIDPLPFIEGGSEPPSYPSEPGETVIPGAPGEEVSPILQPVYNLVKPINDFLTWLRELNYKKLAGDAVIVVGGMVLIILGIYALIQSSAGITVKSIVGKAVGEVAGGKEE